MPSTAHSDDYDIAFIEGSITDLDFDLRPENNTIEWTVVTGPSSAIIDIDDPASLTSTVTFDNLGEYTLQLRVTEDSLSTGTIVMSDRAFFRDDVTVTIGPNTKVYKTYRYDRPDTAIADRLLDIEGPGHLVIVDSRAGFGARLEFLEEVAAAGLKTTFPFTMDPAGPYKVDALDLTPRQKVAVNKTYACEDRYRELMLQLGLRDRQGTTCTPWFKQVGNIPEFDQIIAWAESSAVVFDNSVLGARTHRNAGVYLFNDDELAEIMVAGEISSHGVPQPDILGPS